MVCLGLAGLTKDGVMRKLCLRVLTNCMRLDNSLQLGALDTSAGSTECKPMDPTGVDFTKGEIAELTEKCLGAGRKKSGAYRELMEALPEGMPVQIALVMRNIAKRAAKNS